MNVTARNDLICSGYFSGSPKLLCLVGLFSTFFSLLLFSSAQAEVTLVRGEDRIEVPAIGDGFCLHNLFQSNMVLQRDQPIRIWGWADPGQELTVTFAGKAQKGKAGADRKWSVSFPAMEASATPAKMLIKAGVDSIALENILIGDVWLLGGQSNMEHPISRVENGDLEIASANFPEIRILTVPSQNGPEMKEGFPRLFEWHGFFNTHYRKGDWDVCSPQMIHELSAIGYVFARRLHMASGIPIGVVDASRGGTSLETWLPQSALEAHRTDEVQAMLAEWQKKVAAYDPEKDLNGLIAAHERRVADMKKKGQPIPTNMEAPTKPRPSPMMNMNFPGNCYASMIRPIEGLALKGAIWHQGYNNAMQPEGHMMYSQLFPEMISIWRKAFNNPAMPFGIISLCTDGPPQTEENYLEMMINEGVYIREVQYEAYRKLVEAGDKNIGFASSYDMRRSWYHPRMKIPVGERIARWALATQYGQGRMIWKPPVITKIEAKEGSIHLSFDVPVGVPKDEVIEGFAIAGEDRRYQPAAADYLVLGKDSRGRPRVDAKVLVLSSPHVSKPIHFRYAWGRNPMGNLTPKSNEGGQPLATQRSDDWRIHEVPVKFGAKADRASLNQAREVNRVFDMQRRIKDAVILIETEGENTAKKLESWQKKWD
ncbi:MAG: sialate O-acetylesterase [Akkermansiaceae bacterium]